MLTVATANDRHPLPALTDIRAILSMKQTDPADPLLFKVTTAFRRQVLEPRSLKDTPGQAGRGDAEPYPRGRQDRF